MRANPFLDFACPICEDVRLAFYEGGRGGKKGDPLVRCPGCGSEDRTDLAVERLKRHPCGLEEHELTDKEQARLVAWRAEGISTARALRWIEGQRYDPASDPEFMAECNRELKKWRFEQETLAEELGLSHRDRDAA